MVSMNSLGANKAHIMYLITIKIFTYKIYNQIRHISISKSTDIYIQTITIEVCKIYLTIF